jgi:tetratricopeptide (TPR) repeat protein
VEEAAKSFAASIRIRPHYVEALQNLSDALRELTRHAEAISALRLAIELSPGNAQLHYNLGVLLRDMGDLEEARRTFDRAIALDAGFVGAYYHRVRSGKVDSDSDIVNALEGLAARAGTFPANDRAMLHFALGKVHEDGGRYDEAFAHLLEANRWARSLVDYDEDATRRMVDRLINTFDAPLVAAKAGGGSESNLPIFIVGFPRSGTTLAEQILASHPEVHGGGELGFLGELASRALANDGAEIPYPESLRDLSAESLRQLGNRYVERLVRLDPTAAHITDKNPGNIMHLGLIRLILPKAKIIHMQRDPVDTCLSCFSLRFAGNASSFVYDLGELGRYYRIYQRLMDHWRRVLPPGTVLEVQYENVVENLEAEARRIIDYCGLDWDERCLAFHESNRAVRTASVAQVRQPIYRSSMQRWRRYERHLGVLLRALDLPVTKTELTPP